MPSPWIAGFQLWGFRGEKGMRNGAILLCCGGIIFQNGGFSGGQLRLIFRGDLVRMDFSPRNHWSTYIKLSRKWKNNNRPLFCWVIREAEGVMSIFPEFLKSGYLLLLSMKIYLVGCTLHATGSRQYPGPEVNFVSPAEVRWTRQGPGRFLTW